LEEIIREAERNVKWGCDASKNPQNTNKNGETAAMELGGAIRELELP
jgi:hypothetical protein